MPQYLVANYLPDDFDPSTVTEAMMEEIHALNRELIAAGALKFACGIAPAPQAKTLRRQSDGKVLVTDGPYTETKEHMADSGYWKPPTCMKRWAGRKGLPSPAMCRAKCASCFSTRPRKRASRGVRGVAMEWPSQRKGSLRPAPDCPEEEKTMKYICLGYYDKGKFDSMTDAERNAMFDTCFEYDDHLRANGHWGGGEALQGPETALTLSWKNGKVATTDGPYAETKEQLGGILVLEARDMNHAVQLIGQHPALTYGNIFEIRPAGDMSEIMKVSEQRRRQAAAH